MPVIRPTVGRECVTFSLPSPPAPLPEERGVRIAWQSARAGTHTRGSRSKARSQNHRCRQIRHRPTRGEITRHPLHAVAERDERWGGPTRNHDIRRPCRPGRNTRAEARRYCSRSIAKAPLARTSPQRNRGRPPHRYPEALSVSQSVDGSVRVRLPRQSIVEFGSRIRLEARSAVVMDAPPSMRPAQHTGPANDRCASMPYTPCRQGDGVARQHS